VAEILVVEAFLCSLKKKVQTASCRLEFNTGDYPHLANRRINFEFPRISRKQKTKDEIYRLASNAGTETVTGTKCA